MRLIFSKNHLQKDFCKRLLRPEDILIVNDGSPFLKTIGLILADKGHRTCVTNDPLEARTELARK